MTAGLPSIASLRQMYWNEETHPLEVLQATLERANSNAGRNVYLGRDVDWSCGEARKLRRENFAAQPLWGIPVSLKDCFDLTGFPTSCGSRFYREHLGIAKRDSRIAATLRNTGAVITGKTHMHQLAYGITGENQDDGDCLQPLDASLLTGGSSSGAAASVQEGSAVAAIGTDTGGSVRAPAAFCGVAGYRSSITLNPPEVWEGGHHLAATFDTVGWLYGDLSDGPLLGHALLGLPIATTSAAVGVRIGTPDTEFLHDCEDDVLETLRYWENLLTDRGAKIDCFHSDAWNDSLAIYAPLQASEAAALHRGFYRHFEPAIAERLEWGASLPSAQLLRLRQQLAHFRSATNSLFGRFDYLLLPCAPMASIAAGADHTQTRGRILRYTTPISLAGLPVVTLPRVVSGRAQGGIQLVGPMGSDSELLALSATFSENHEKDATLHP